ncbi:MAG: hypothetical protein JXQ80_04635, partial [Bacteroidales bacterium]|nr:hypothetical protein [Bacteroidales bacterium]
EGKPWNFIFWWRYKLLNVEKFSLGFGAHPAFSFSTVTDTAGGVKKEHIRSDRYLAGEITPYVPVTKNIGLGLHYIYARGVEKDIIRNTHYIAFRTVFTGIRITDDLYCRFVPQVYYLNMDQRDGWYLNSSVVFSRKNFPLAVSALINQSLRTEIAAKDDLLWNISLIYTFHREFVVKHN